MSQVRATRIALKNSFLSVLVFALAACTSVDPPFNHSPTPTPTPRASISSVDTSSIRSIIESPRDSPSLTVTGSAPAISNETAQEVKYSSGGKTVTGVVRTPMGQGPFPAVVVVHGAVDPAKYTSGGDLVETQRALLHAGYIVFAPDLRGYAGSDPAQTAGNLNIDPGFGWSIVLDWGMALDVVNALQLLRSGAIDHVDTTRIGLLGHSMGGLLALDAAVIAPGSSELVIALSAPASDFAELVGSLDATKVDGLQALLDKVGTPSENPKYWADISPRSFFDRATEPLLLIHGGADKTTLPAWSKQTAAAWLATGNSSEAIIIAGADHHLAPHLKEANDTIVKAFDAVIGPGG
jgi:dipeptidyl aminopeptidase/acylaminoacyl peptidase